MADSPDERGLFPDSISGDRLRELASRLSNDLPVSDVIPALEFRDVDINSGGLCDLQFVLIQLVEKSKSGLEYVQLLTASLYLFERCFDFLSESIKEAKDLRGQRQGRDPRRTRLLPAGLQADPGSIRRAAPGHEHQRDP